jgi:hypothetical protein
MLLNIFEETDNSSFKSFILLVVMAVDDFLFQELPKPFDKVQIRGIRW